MEKGNQGSTHGVDRRGRTRCASMKERIHPFRNAARPTTAGRLVRIGGQSSRLPALWTARCLPVIKDHLLHHVSEVTIKEWAWRGERSPWMGTWPTTRITCKAWLNASFGFAPFSMPWPRVLPPRTP
eukprot:scaffold1949_cov348-Pavlova_lutheri.AAC.16